MVATVSWSEQNSSGNTGSIANLNFGSTDAPNIVALDYPVNTGTNSYEKWITGSFGGTFTKINNVQFWKSAGAYVTGETIFWSGSVTTFVTPAATASTYAVGSVPAADPATANVSIHSSLTGSLLAVGSTDYIVLQQQITSAASPGATNQKTFTIQYDEV